MWGYILMVVYVSLLKPYWSSFNGKGHLACCWNSTVANNLKASVREICDLFLVPQGTQTSSASESNGPCHYIDSICYGLYNMELFTLSTNHAPAKRSLQDNSWHHECQISVHQPRSKLWWSLTVKAFEAPTNNLRNGVASACTRGVQSMFIRVWLCPTLHSKGKFSLKQMRLVNL